MPKKLSKRKGPGRVGPAKIRDAEYRAWLCATLKEGWLTAGWIHSLAWGEFRGRGVKPEGVGGAIRRLLQQHCSSCKWFKKGGADLFVREDGCWSLKAGAAQAA